MLDSHALAEQAAAHPRETLDELERAAGRRAYETAVAAAGILTEATTGVAVQVALVRRGDRIVLGMRYRRDVLDADAAARLVDNIAMAHSREAYEGPREVLAALADPVRVDESGAVRPAG